MFGIKEISSNFEKILYTMKTEKGAQSHPILEILCTFFVVEVGEYWSWVQA